MTYGYDFMKLFILSLLPIILLASHRNSCLAFTFGSIFCAGPSGNGMSPRRDPIFWE